MQFQYLVHINAKLCLYIILLILELQLECSVIIFFIQDQVRCELLNQYQASIEWISEHDQLGFPLTIISFLQVFSTFAFPLQRVSKNIKKSTSLLLPALLYNDTIRSKGECSCRTCDHSLCPLLPGNSSSRYSLIGTEKCGCAPSY